MIDRDSICKQLQGLATEEQAVLANLHRVPAALPFLNDLQRIDGARALCQDWLRQLDTQEAEAAKAALPVPATDAVQRDADGNLIDQIAAGTADVIAEPAILPFAPPPVPAS